MYPNDLSDNHWKKMARFARNRWHDARVLLVTGLDSPDCG